ncbi:MAG: UDP-N-acetylmuramoyl-tripeptide--D-alanyl-D-alanine ligase [Clostridia bacterium]|nr:UDP-N-acetylmuramoyl-tripeptide--D-alanyl-D-alanine ligase [Clostridia bacterium]
MQLTVGQLLEAVNGTLLYGNRESTFRYVCTDSRQAMTTELFIPLVGEVHDGHQYLKNAVANGAAGFLTQTEAVPENAGFAVLVEDTTKALGQLASYVRDQLDVTVIGITGSVGKTTTRQFVASVVSQLGKTLATSGNFNNHIGLPLTILKAEGDEKYLVLEMGMNHLGEISYLSRIAKPDIGIITMIGTSHIEYLGSRENILKAKMEITDGMNDKGILLLHGDNDLLSQASTEKQVYYFGETNARYPYRVVSEDGVFWMDEATYEIPITGIHNIQNASAAVLLGKLLGATPKEIQSGLSAFQSVGLRQKTETLGEIQVILDCYNASADSDKAALRVLGKTKGQRKIAVLGPIGELGEFQSSILQEVGEAVQENQIDKLVCVEEASHWIQIGAMDAGMNPEDIVFCPNREEFIQKTYNLWAAGDVVLFKASRAYRLEELYENLKQFLSDNKE